jgi:hypothetical protein
MLRLAGDGARVTPDALAEVDDEAVSGHCPDYNANARRA